MMSWMSTKTEEKNRVSSKKGYLLKLRRSQNLLAPQWGSRWFSIEGRYFKWYRSENDISPSGMVNLKFVRNISKMESSGAFTFNVSCPDRNLVLRCTNLQEMNGWMKALHIHADIARGGTGTNVVSDFNEESGIRNPSVTTKRNTKLRSSLTLEQEFDLNLKRLDALEKAVHTPDEKKSAAESMPYEPVVQQKYTKPYNSKNTPIFKKSIDDYDDYNPTDVLGKLRNITSENAASTTKGGKSMHRNDSTSSVEEISMSAYKKNFSSNNNNNIHNNDRRKSKDYGESSQTTKQRRRQRLGFDSDEEHSDEFDTNSDCDNTPPRKDNRNSGGRSNSSSGRGGGRNSSAKLSTLSMDSVDSETFHYIPEVSQNDRNSSNYSKPQHYPKGNVRSAW